MDRGTGPDLVYKWAAPSNGDYTFDLDNHDSASLDLVFYIRTCANSQVGYDSTTGALTDRQIVLNGIESGEGYLIFVDSAATNNGGNFSLDIIQD